MPFVRKPDRFSQDIIIPGRVTDPYGFITEHREIEGLSGPIKIYFSITGLRHLAAKYPEVGLVPEDELRAAKLKIEELHDQIDALHAQLDEAESKLERIAGLSKDGFKVQRVQGRPPKKEAVK